MVSADGGGDQQQEHERGRVSSMQKHLNEQHADTPTIAECLAAFFVDAAGRVAVGDLAESTRYSYQGYARYITASMRETPVAALRRPAVKAWHRALALRRHPVTSRRLTAAADNALRFLSILLTWVEVELDVDLDACPTGKLRRLHKTVGARAFSPDDLASYRNALAVHEQVRTLKVRGMRDGRPRLVAAHGPIVALRLLDLTGCRPSEIRTARVEDVHLEESVLRLGRTKTDDRHARPLSRAACEVLRRHIARLGSPTEGWLFPSARNVGACISDSCLSRAHREVCLVAGIKAPRYALRHTMVSQGFAAGFTSTATSGVAGHTREKSFHEYRHLIPRESFDLVEAHASASNAGARPSATAARLLEALVAELRRSA